MYDVAIIGAGPAGASAAVFTARAGLKTVLLDADQSITRRAWLPNHLGFPEGVSGPQLVEKGKAHAARVGAELVPAKVAEIAPQTDGFAVRLDGGGSVEARQVILCLGVNVELARQAGAAIRPGTEPHIKEVVSVDAEGRSSVAGIWAAGACAGSSPHTIIAAGDAARVAVSLISQVRGQRHVDHESMPK